MSMLHPSAFLRWNLLITDLGFLAYWTITALGVLPADWLFKDYDNPIIQAWNWSFAPLDLLASGLGLAALASHRRDDPRWRGLASASVMLTFCAGFMAISFWTVRQDFDISWWLPNVYLTLWPIVALRELLRQPKS